MGQKTLFLRSDNFAMTYDRKACTMSEVSEFGLKWYAYFACQCSYIFFALVVQIFNTPKIALNLTMMHEFCSIFIRNTIKQGRSLTHVVSQDKWPPFALITILSLSAAGLSLGSVCPGFTEPRSQLDLASADQCLKFCEVTPLLSSHWIICGI